MNVGSRDFRELLGEDLSGVTFVRDYVQLQFNPPPTLNVYTPVTVRVGSRTARSGQAEFPAALVAQIGKYVRRVEFRVAESLQIGFDDDSSVSVSLRASDYSGPEAINLTRLDGGMIVV